MAEDGKTRDISWHTEATDLIRDEILKEFDIDIYAIDRPHEIPHVCIRRMRELGLKTKPPEITHAMWLTPNEWSERHHIAFYMKANGLPNDEIQVRTGYGKDRLAQLFGSPEAKRQIAEYQDLIFGQDAKKLLNSLYRPGIQAIHDILHDPKAKESAKLDAAKFVVDHMVGKAKQDIKVEGNLLHDFITRLDQTKNVIPLAAHKDEADNFLDGVIPENNLTVGQRSLGATGREMRNEGEVEETNVFEPIRRS